MSDPANVPDDFSESLYFQILLLGTILFLGALFWFGIPPHTNSFNEGVVAANASVVIGNQIQGCYLAFVSLVFAHKFLRRKKTSA
jgi:hypothetical protein